MEPRVSIELSCIGKLYRSRNLTVTLSKSRGNTRISRQVLRLLIWMSAVLGCYIALIRYDRTSAPLNGQRVTSEASSVLTTLLGEVRTNDKRIVCMALHPECACSTNSLEAFAKLAEHDAASASFAIIIALPDGSSRWRNTSNIRKAFAIPNTSVVFDELGKHCQRLGLNASGSTIVVGKDGHLLYNGGLTQSRSCFSENASFNAAKIAIENGNAQAKPTPVYGCKLTERS